jgi:hypothetical protein
MATLFEKLNLKDHGKILVLNAPASFEQELRTLQGVRVARKLQSTGPVSFAVIFVTSQSQLDAAAVEVAEAAPGDPVIWFAYPKGTSKRYSCDFNRDTGWKVLGEQGFEPVRQVAIDEDWSALRFRRTEFIKSLTRTPEHALSKEGKKRAAARQPSRR